LPIPVSAIPVDEAFTPFSAWEAVSLFPSTGPWGTPCGRPCGCRSLTRLGEGQGSGGFGRQCRVSTASQTLKRLPLFSKNRGYGEICAMPTPFANEGVRAKAETGFLARQRSTSLHCHTVAWTAPTLHRTYPGSPPSAYALQPSTFSSPDGREIPQAARITSSIVPPPTTRSSS
jgi:hypothetical protein